MTEGWKGGGRFTGAGSPHTTEAPEIFCYSIFKAWAHGSTKNGWSGWGWAHAMERTGTCYFNLDGLLAGMDMKEGDFLCNFSGVLSFAFTLFSNEDVARLVGRGILVCMEVGQTHAAFEKY